MRTRSSLSLASLAAAVGLAACAGIGSSNSSTDVAAIGRSIDSLDINVQRWFATGAVDSIVAGYYTSDAVFMNTGSPPSKGSEAIRKGLNDMYSTAGIRLHFQRSSLVAADSLASDQGHFTLEIRDKKDTAKVLMSDHGNYVTTFVKRNGQWRALYDIGTSEVPPPAPPAAKSSSKKKE
jgi:ketosteroid isomerase-like protein